MTAIFYPDCQATSSNGRYTLEARSPHNGTILHRDGSRPADDEFGFKYQQHQSEFRYQLIDNATEQVIWERWQPRFEDSPHELVVSDEGWAILRTHGFGPELIAVTPDGEDAVRVQLLGSGCEQAPIKQSSTPVFRWNLKYVTNSTAGIYWSSHSWRYFLDKYFVWRTSWGQRLLIDLKNRAAFSPEPPELAARLDEEEKRGLISFLADFSGRINSVRQADGRFLVSGALHLAGVHRVKEAIPYLREWEVADFPSYYTGTEAFPSPWWLESEAFRPIIQTSLKLIGAQPGGFATYYFSQSTEDRSKRIPMPEQIADRQTRLALVQSNMSAKDVLELVGSPDFIGRASRKEGQRYAWSESWEYDFKTSDEWTTLRITWEDCQILNIEEVAPYWLESDERERAWLRP